MIKDFNVIISKGENYTIELKESVDKSISVIHDYIVNERFAITDNFKESEYLRFLEKSNISNVLPREDMLKNLDCGRYVKQERAPR
jgi:hypothetical protein